MSRAVNTFFAYPGEVTPYDRGDFSAEVKAHCDAEFNALFPPVVEPNGKQSATQAVNASSTFKNRLRVAKCIVVGDISVGKTSLIQRFGYNIYGNDYKATIGVDFDVQKFDILRRPFSLQIWDTAGEDRFRAITRSYYRGAHVAIIVFDLSNMSSFLNVRCWLNEILGDQAGERPLIFLVGSKKDLLTYERVEFFELEARKLAVEIGAEFWMISSQTGDSVVQLFNRIACLTFGGLIEDEMRMQNEQEALNRTNQANGPNVQYRKSATAEGKLRRASQSQLKSEINGECKGIRFINRKSGLVCFPKFFQGESTEKKKISQKKSKTCQMMLARQRDNLQALSARLRMALANLCTKMSKSPKSASVAPSVGSEERRKSSIISLCDEPPAKKTKTFQFFRLKCIVAVD